MQRAFDLVTRFPSPLLIIRQPIVSNWESLMDPIHCRPGLYRLTVWVISMHEEKSRFWQTVGEILSFLLSFFPCFFLLTHLLSTHLFSCYLFESFLPSFLISFAVVLYWLATFWHLFSHSDCATAYRISLGSFPANYSHFAATHYTTHWLTVISWHESYWFRQGHCDTISYLFLAYGRFSL